MTSDRFAADFFADHDRETVWRQLTAKHPDGDVSKLWLAGFDAIVTIETADAPQHLHAVKDHEPCGGTHIDITLAAEGAGTRMHVTQSDFGDWLAAIYEVIGIGWRHIVADLEAFVASGVHVGRHARPWGDLGADAATAGGGVLLGNVRSGGLADRLGLASGDVLVVLSGAPMSCLDDVFTALRVLQDSGASVQAEWIRSGSLMAAEVTG